MKRISAVLCLLLLAAGVMRAQDRLALHAGWLLRSSAGIGVDGAMISSPTYRPTGWYRATVPSTVVGALVEDGVYPDPFFAMNMRALPGMTYPIGANFVHTPMEPQSPFAVVSTSGVTSTRTSIWSRSFCRVKII